MKPEDWTILVGALRVLSPALAGYAIYILKQILTELRSLNDRVKTVEEWQKAHDGADNMRFAYMQREIDRLEKE